MTTGSTRGFTVIELMLFLGVSGALFAALMIGVNSTIAQQRYKESVISYSSLLQDQFFQVMNTRNEREDNLACQSGNVSQPVEGGQAKGTSSCVILGRAIQVERNGSAVRTWSVIGEDQPLDSGSDDTTALGSYVPKLWSSSTNSNPDANLVRLDWDSMLMPTEDSGPYSQASFLILRSPVSGLIRVFASNDPLPNDLKERLTPEAANAVITNCVTGSSGSIPIQSVTVDAKVAGPDGVIVDERGGSCA